MHLLRHSINAEISFTLLSRDHMLMHLYINSQFCRVIRWFFIQAQEPNYKRLTACTSIKGLIKILSGTKLIANLNVDSLKLKIEKIDPMMILKT